MKDLFLNHELSLLVKEKGFDEDCLAYYNKHSRLIAIWDDISNPVQNSGIYKEECTAPLYSQIIQWILTKLDKPDNNPCIIYFEDESGEWKLNDKKRTIIEFGNLSDAIEKIFKFI